MKKNIFYKSIIISFILIISLSFFAACEEGPNFRIIEYPDFSVTGISKTEGYPTTNVTITGSGFGDLKGAVKVFFGGVQATNIVSVSDTEIIVTVPANAVSGVVNVKVWTNTHDLNENFTVIPSPTITSVSSDAGSPGDQITIVGTGFVGLSNMSISFNGTAGTINSVNPEGTTIVATVPNGFTSGPIVLSIFDYRLTGPGFAYLVPVPQATYQLDFENNLNETFGGTAATYTQGLGSPLSYITGINPGTKGIYLAGYSNASGGTNQNILNQVLALPANVGKYNELTVACWVQYLTADRTNWTPIWEFGQTRGNKIALYGQTSRSGTNMEGRIFFENVTGFTGYNETWYATTKGIPSTGWHHLAMTLSKANLKMTVYLDGLAVGSKALPALYDLNLYNQTRAYIGTQAYGNANEAAIKASYDKFQIFNSALSADQIYTLFYKK